MKSNFTKLDMHVHSQYSADSDLKLTRLAKFLDDNKDFGIVLCDHNEIAGAIELNQSYPDRVIIGEEIRTEIGEITGIFLKEKIEHGRRLNWTMDAVLAQGGLIYLPHPTDRLRTSKLTVEGLEEAVRKADIIESFNSRNVFAEDDRKALKLAKENDILIACGSDAHTRFELGRSYVNFSGTFELTPEAMLRALEDATLTCRRSFIGVHFITKAKKMSVKYKSKR